MKKEGFRIEKFENLYRYLIEDIEKGKIFKNDYLRVKRDPIMSYEILKNYGVLLNPIIGYIYDYEVIPYDKKEDYEIMQVNEILRELIKMNELFKTYEKDM